MATGRLSAVELDAASIGRGTTEVEHERRIAIAELIEEGRLDAPGRDGGTYRLKVSLVDDKLGMAVNDGDDAPLCQTVWALAPVRKLVRDYFLICDNYYAALKTATPEQIEAIDMGRRSVHDEGSAMLKDRLAERLNLDFETARRLFTVVCTLLWKG